MITITPGQNIQTIINNNFNETEFQLQDGIHRITNFLTLRSGLILQGQSRNAILSGGRLLHQSTDAGLGGWQQSGSTNLYFITGQTQQGTVNNLGQCEVGFPECHQPEDLWINGVLQIPQSTLSAVTQAGEWFFDYAGDRIYVWGHPGSKEIETSVVQKAIRANVHNATIFRMSLEKFAVPFQSGAIEKEDGGTGWLIEDVLIKQCHGQAVRMGLNWQLRNSRLSEIGQLGLGGGGSFVTGILVENTEIDNCGISGINPGAAGGAMKLTSSDGSRLINCNIHDCPGNGLWWDIDNKNFLCQGCTVEDIGGQGVFTEIGLGGGRVTGCTVRRCGHGRSNSAGFGAGIFVAATKDIEIDNNVVEDCHNGITGSQQNRGDNHVILNLNVHDNTVTLLQTGGDPQRVGLWVGFQPTTAPDLYSAAANNRFTNNTYNLAGAVSNPFFWNSQNMTLAQWRAAGNDVPSSSIVLSPGQWKYDAGTLYVRCTDDANPATKAMQIFDWRFGMEEVVLLSLTGSLIGRLCRHFSYIGDPAAVDADAARGASMSYDGSRVVFGSNRGGGAVGIYAVLTDPNA